MRPVTFAGEDILNLFYQQKVMTMERLLELTGCSATTAWRVLNRHGYISSYNHNGKDYTLDDIPQFDEHGLWVYRKSRFSIYGSLTGTICELVHHSDSGADAAELAELPKVNVRPALTNLYHYKRLQREKLAGVYVYFSLEQQRKEIQAGKRQHQIKTAKTKLALPEPERIIAVLVELVQRPELTVEQLQRRLKRKGLQLGRREIRQIFDHYELAEKKGRLKS